MSIRGNNTSKNYPNINPTAPKNPQTYHLEKLTEMLVYLYNEIEVWRRLKKKIKVFNIIKSLVDTGLLMSTVITGGISIAIFASGAGLLVVIALSGTSLLFSLATSITQKTIKIFIAKQEKHEAIKLVAQSKLGSIADIISQAMQDERKISQT